MATSSILGGDKAAEKPAGKDAESLGPSDSSDSGSDTAGLGRADSDAAGTGERGSAAGDEPDEASDITPDRVVGRDGGKPPPGARRASDLREFAAEEERSRDA